MKRVFLSCLIMAIVIGVGGYAAGFFTSEIHRDDSCLLCRSIRHSGMQYGFGYERIEENVLTDWYRRNIDPKHGADPSHEHVWQQSACTMSVHPGFGKMDYACVRVAPVFLLRPEIELAVLQNLPSKAQQVALIHNLDSGDRVLDTRRVRRLIEWYHIERFQVNWERWWKDNARLFDLPSPAGTRKR